MRVCEKLRPARLRRLWPDLFRHACLMGLEGLVSKRRDSVYRGGRSPHWVKVKNRQHQAFSRVRADGGRMARV